jgi:outer membrane protein
VLSNATNVTHWGLGVGAGIEQAPYKGYGTKFTPIPLILFDDKWVHILGTTVDLKIGKWSNVSLALRGKFALGDGYKGSDAPILNGMQNRNGAFWYGPALAWRTGFGTLSGDYLLGGNKGERAKIDFSKSFDYGNFSLEPHAGVEWLSSKYVNYYYGVRSSEVRAGRPEYTGKAAEHVGWNACRLQVHAPSEGDARPRRVASWQWHHRQPDRGKEVRSRGQARLPLSIQLSAPSCRESQLSRTTNAWPA